MSVKKFWERRRPAVVVAAKGFASRVPTAVIIVWGTEAAIHWERRRPAVVSVIKGLRVADADGGTPSLPGEVQNAGEEWLSQSLLVE